MDITELFGGGGIFYNLGIAIWNVAMKLIGATAMQTPQSFSPWTWTYVVDDVMSWTLGFGAMMLNIFYMIGIIRQSSNLKDNFTLEIMVDSFIKVIGGNFLLINGTTLMSLFFQIAALLSGGFLSMEEVHFAQIDLDVGAIFFYNSLGLFFMAFCLVCAGTIFLTIYGRYLQLYLLVATGPFAWSTVPGGQGISNTASSWIRTFLSKCFEIVVIAIAVSIASRMCGSIRFGDLDGIGENFDGAIQALQNMATMLILTGAVKGADMFMKRTFGL